MEAADAEEQTGQGRIPFRLTIGVVGHRSIPHEAELVPAIRVVLDRVAALLPSTRNTQVLKCVITPLADGADRLVAQVALEDPDTILETVLPLRREEYEETFRSDESRQEFHRLLALASSVRQMPPARTRDDAYKATGEQIVDRCDILLALWDGEATRGKGDTAETVEYARNAGVPLLWLKTEPPFDVQEENGEGIPRETLGGLERYNERQFDASAFDAEVSKRVSELEALADDAGLSSADVEPYCLWALPAYCRADASADRAQRVYRLVGVTMIFSAAAAVVVAAVQALFFANFARLATIESGLLVVVLLLLYVARRRGHHQYWLSNRFLAERFRAALFLAVAGAEAEWQDRRPSARRDSSYYAGDWARRAFQEVWRKRPSGLLPPPAAADSDSDEYSQAAAVARFLDLAWISDQMRYHERMAPKHHRRHVALERAAFALFITTLTAATLHALGIGGHGAHGAFSAPALLAFLAISLPAIAGAFGALQAQRQYERNSERFRGIAALLAEKSRRIAQASTGSEVAARAWEAEHIMLEENNDWFVTMHFQPPRPPA